MDTRASTASTRKNTFGKKKWKVVEKDKMRMEEEEAEEEEEEEEEEAAEAEDGRYLGHFLLPYLGIGGSSAFDLGGVIEL